MEELAIIASRAHHLDIYLERIVMHVMHHARLVMEGLSMIA